MNLQGHEKKNNLQLQRKIAIASSVLLIVKFTAYYITHSVSILTDALESIVNVVAAFIGLYSLYVSAKPRDMDHPYGHGKAEFVSAAVEGTLIFSAGAIIIYSGVRNLFIAQTLQKIDLGICLVGATAIINWVLGYFSLQQGRKNDSLALIASGRHLQTDTYSTFGIMLGLVLIIFTGYTWIDGAIAIAFGVFIIYTGYTIIRKSLAGIMDEADMDLLKNMVAVLNANRRDAWVDLHNLRVIKYGNILHVDCHLTVPWYFNINQSHEEIDVLGNLIRKDFGESLELFVHSDGCEYFQCPICDKKACPVRQHSFENEVVWTVNNILQNQKHASHEAVPEPPRQ